MSYTEVLQIVLLVLWGISSLAVLHYLFFTILGIFKRKKFPKADKKLRYAIMIGARNEEAVIGKLIDSIKNSDYPADKLTVFVLAHNCTDKTADIARSHGAVVYEYDNPEENTLGYAYKALIANINEDYGYRAFDGIFSINADNIIPTDYFDLMNDAFVYYGAKNVVTSFRNSGNFNDNYMSSLYGMYFISCCRYEMRGRTLCGCSTRISGTGYVFPSELIKDGWEYVTLTEDWEFSADQVAAGRKIYYCDQAEFFDEQPTTVKIMLRQRLRWARGHTIVFFTRFKKLVASIFKPNENMRSKERFSSYDLAVSIMPLGAIGLTMGFLTAVLVGLTPLIQDNGWEIVKNALIWFGGSFVVSYVLTALSGALIYFIERKRIPKGFWRHFAAILLWPFFLLLTCFLDFISLFTKNLAWKSIPHKGSEALADENANAKNA
ncbi:MAG: glycosyltransferase family 2 protein [Clostridia bacterium]|nr:glycosyltransferase family 2 protein [Clostridia bacterium]